jgi:hypothetical protein
MANSLLGNVHAGGAAYMNPSIPPEVVKLLAEMGYAPDGTPLADMGAGIGTAFNRVMNPIRDAVGVRQAELPEGVEPVDYSGIGKAFDGFMAGFGGADPYRKGITRPGEPQPMGKDQSRVPETIPRPDMAPPMQESMGLQRQMSGDMPPQPGFGDATRMRQMMLNRQIDADMAAMDAPPPQMPVEAPKNPVGGMSYTPALPPPPPATATVPKPKPRPRPETYVVRAGDNPTKIARKLGLSLAELEAMNPGILENSRRLKIGSSLKV